MAKQANAVFKEKFTERKDPYGQPYYWMDGEMENFDLNNGTDLDALEANYVSVVPVKYDLTDYDELEIMKKEWEL